MLVVLVNFMKVPSWDETGNAELDVVEMFAGVARIAKLAAWLGMKSRAYDIAYCPVRNPYRKKRNKLPRSPMDLNGSAGFVSLRLV